MYRLAHSIIALSATVLLATAAGAAPATQSATAGKATAASKSAATSKDAANAKAAPAAPTAHVVEYSELEQHVGDTIIVETTFDTVRRGKLVRYTNPGLALQLGPEDGSIELEVPRETVRNVSVVDDVAATPAQEQKAVDSAKKN